MMRIALLVVSCDAYMDVAKYFFELKKKYMGWWNYPCYLINNTVDVNFEGVTTINCGDDLDWNGRLRKALEYIPEDYVLYVQEDYFIGRNVDEQMFLNALVYIENNNINYYKIDNFPKIHGKIPNYEYLSPIPSNKRYGINLLTAIIRKQWLLEKLPSEDTTAWAVETSFLKKVTDKFQYNYDGCVLDKRQIIDIHYAVRNGKWWPATIRYFNKNGFVIDTSKRGMLDKKRVFRNQFGSFINHTIPTSVMRKIKRLLIKMGGKFASEN